MILGISGMRLAFDPTTEPLTRAWDLRGAGREPGPWELAAARARVGWRGLRLDPAARTARRARGAAVDLGGIGKGYALDRMVERLRRRGIQAGWLDFGGCSRPRCWCSAATAHGTFAREHPDVGVLWLEPGAGGVRAWAWNLPHDRLTGAGGVAWQTPGPGATPGRSLAKGTLQ